MRQTVIAILGTLAGAAVSAWFQQRGQRAERAATEAAAQRREAVDSVTELVAALADHRRAMWLREEARLAGGDWREARAASHATRAAITAPAVGVTVLLPSLADTAKAAANATYAMRNATDHATLGTARASNAAELGCGAPPSWAVRRSPTAVTGPHGERSGSGVRGRRGRPIRVWAVWSVGSPARWTHARGDDGGPDRRPGHDTKQIGHQVRVTHGWQAERSSRA
ncbi:hypothetical protein ACWCO0_23050 [Streptomyces tubercidicus]